MSAIAARGPFPAVPIVHAPSPEAAVLRALDLPGYPDGMTMGDLAHRTGMPYEALYGALTALLAARRATAREGREKGLTVARYSLRGEDGR